MKDWPEYRLMGILNMLFLFIQDREYPEWPAIRCPCNHDIIAPDMVLARGSQRDTRAISRPQPASSWLLLRHF